MDVWSPSAVPVGILWWNAPMRRLTVIAKMTLVPKAGSLALADEQEPLRAAVPSTLGIAEELHYPGDFVPFKPRCDVLVVGSAYTQQPASTIPVHFRIGSLERRVYALAGHPSTSIPLSSRYLRQQPTTAAEAAAIGPLSPLHATRARLADARIPVRSTGFERATLPADFDSRYFNTAPPEQQIDPLSPGVAFVAPWRGETQNMWVPPMRPRIFTFDTTSESGLREISLTCDTVWIDTDQSKCVLTYRGLVDQTYENPFPTALVAVFASAYDALLAGAAQAICSRAAKRPAVEPKDVEGFVSEASPPSDKPPASNRAAQAKPSRTLPPADDEGTKVYSPATLLRSAVPFSPKTLPIPDDPPRRAFGRDDEAGTRILSNLPGLMNRPTTLPFVRSTDDSAGESEVRPAGASNPAAVPSALPFVSANSDNSANASSSSPARPPVLPFASSARAFDALSDSRIMPSPTTALPFVQAQRPADEPPPSVPNLVAASALPFVSTSRSADTPATPAANLRPSNTLIPDLVPSQPVLPFVSTERESWVPPAPTALPFVSNERDPRGQPAPSALPFVSTERESWLPQVPSPLPFVSNEPASAASPIPPTALDSPEIIRISIDTFAEIKVDLWCGVGLREALAKHGIDQRSYHLFERRQTDELGEEVRQGALDRTRALRAALRRARERRAPISNDDVLL